MSCGTMFDVKFLKRTGCSIILHPGNPFMNRNGNADELNKTFEKTMAVLKESNCEITLVSRDEYEYFFNDHSGAFTNNFIKDLKSSKRPITDLLKYGSLEDMYGNTLYAMAAKVQNFWTGAKLIEIGNPSIDVNGMPLSTPLILSGYIDLSVDELKELKLNNIDDLYFYSDYRNLDKKHVFESNDGKDIGFEQSLSCNLAIYRDITFSFDEIMELGNPLYKKEPNGTRTLANIMASAQSVTFTNKQIGLLGNPYDNMDECTLKEQSINNLKRKTH